MVDYMKLVMSAVERRFASYLLFPLRPLPSQLSIGYCLIVPCQ